MKTTKTFEFLETEIEMMLRLHVNAESSEPKLSNFKIKNITPIWDGLHHLKIEIEETDENPPN